MSENNSFAAAEERYGDVVQAFIDSPLVSAGTPDGIRQGSAFGSSSLRINNKIFAMLSSKKEFVVKLPRYRVDSLVASGTAVRFDPGHGRLMKEWAVIRLDAAGEWLALAREAMDFVGSQR